MKQVSDAFLLGLAEVQATLIGFLLVAMYFFIDRKKDQFAAVWEQGFPYLRAAIRMVLLLYSFALALTLGMVVLDDWIVVVLFGVMTAAGVAGGIDVTLRHRQLKKVAEIRGTAPWLMWVLLAVILAPPWLTQGLAPGRSEIVIAVLLASVFAFVNTAGFLLSAFDLEGIVGKSHRNQRHAA